MFLPLDMERGCCSYLWIWSEAGVPTSGYGLQRGEAELVESLGAHQAAGLAAAAVIGKLLLGCSSGCHSTSQTSIQCLGPLIRTSDMNWTYWQIVAHSFKSI